MIRRVAFMIAFFRESLPRDRAYSPVRHSGVHTTGKGQTRLDIPNVGLLHAQVPTVHTLSAPFFLFFRIHSVVFLFSESNFLSAPPTLKPRHRVFRKRNIIFMTAKTCSTLQCTNDFAYLTLLLHHIAYTH